MENVHTFIPSPLGPLGVAWGPRGLRGIAFPGAGADEAEPLARLQERLGPTRPAVPPAAIARALGRIERHLAGTPQDLTGIALDLAGLPPFHRRVYDASRAIPAGTTVTYGQLAARVGSPGAARAVGQAMAKNPFAIVVPCHRVVASGGRAGGFSAPGGLRTKGRLLALEGVLLQGGGLFRGAGAWSYDPAVAIRRLSEADPRLGRLIDRVGPFRLRPDALQSPFAALVEAIVHQQLTGKAAATILARVKALFEGRSPTPSELWDAPPPGLRAAGLSGAKVLALKDLAAKAQDGTLPPLAELERMDDEALVLRLTQVRGVGRWTVEMLLLFRLGRPDVLPLGDYGIKKGFARTFGLRELPTQKQLAHRGQRWRPYRSVASWYLWRSLDIPA